MNLDTSNWKTFLLKDLYVVTMGTGLDKNKTTQDNPSINFVSRISYNNGVDIKVDLVDNIEPYPQGMLTVSLGGEYLGSCYIQEEPFYTAQNVAVLKPRFVEMNHNVNVFISSLVKYECKTKYYAFGRELNTHINTDFEIDLPVLYDAKGKQIIDRKKQFSEEGYIPDWEFMENYINSLQHKPITTKIKNNTLLGLDTIVWKEFMIPRLFNVEAGEYYKEDQYGEGNIPYISASNANNGVGKKTDLTPDFTSNKITIGKIGATTFYQSEDFCATSDVNVLTPLFDMNKYHALFITGVINYSENYKWSYGRQCRVGDTKEIVIKLPIKVNKDKSPIIDETKQFSEEGYIPDWEFMENYIKSLPYGDRI